MIDPLRCKNCYHYKESHRYGYLECENFDFTWTVNYDWLGLGYPERSIITKQCNCKSFQPFDNLCSNKITWYIDKDIVDTSVAIWSHEAPYMEKSPMRDAK
jgi:hypothetical protein